jgi:3-hydroxyisobutyrate dehydrogenase-like beta-hydroxyacid dehydrogenase
VQQETLTLAPRTIRRVGVIGTGRIGQPIVGHLVRKGFQVVAHDIDVSKQQVVETRGAEWTTDAVSLAQSADAILVSVGYDRELRALVTDDLCRACPAGSIVAVLSTVQPRTVRELSARAASFAVRLVDATLCRGGRAADEGTLLAFVAGPSDVVEQLTPVLTCFCTDIVSSGEVGTAQVAKSANNMLMWACLIANHEALALARREGVDVELLRAALLKTGARNGVLEHWGTSTMAWADDDLAIVQEMAVEAGIAVPQASLNRELCRVLKPKKFQLDEYGK